LRLEAALREQRQKVLGIAVEGETHVQSRTHRHPRSAQVILSGRSLIGDATLVIADYDAVPAKLDSAQLRLSIVLKTIQHALSIDAAQEGLRDESELIVHLEQSELKDLQRRVFAVLCVDKPAVKASAEEAEHGTRAGIACAQPAADQHVVQ